MFINPFKNYGLLGINARNLLYIRPFNPKKSVSFADNKLKTKMYLSTRGIPSAKLYARIETRQQLYDFDFKSLPDNCVLKPNFGFGGEGILILKRKNGQFTRNGKVAISDKEIFEHIEDILDGKFSVNGRRDTAFFEQILIPHTCFAPFRPAGLPDIRVIVFNLVPVMAQVRIPTAESDGKANLHLGGIGLGVDIAKGITSYGVYHNRITSELPHGGNVAGHTIPFWDEMLLICSQIQYHTNIGYLAVDLTIDEQIGPALLEVNARAGLAVQTANLAPLRSRLERVQGITVSSPEKGVRIAQELFGEKITRSEKIDTRPILGTHEVVRIAGDGEQIELSALIAPGQERTMISPKLARDLLKKQAIDVENEEDQIYRIKFTLGEKKIQTIAKVQDIAIGKENMLIGSRDLSDFLIDPAKKPERKVKKASITSDVRAVDQLLGQLDRELLLLKHLKPSNLEAVRGALREDYSLNPILEYAPLPFDIDEVERKLEEAKTENSPLGQIQEKKRRELLLRIGLLRERGSGNTKRFTQLSKELYGSPTSGLIRSANAMLKHRPCCNMPVNEADLLSAEEAKQQFSDVLRSYGLHEWSAVTRQKLLADCTVGGNQVYIRAAARFTQAHLNALIAHEIETHVLCAENGNHQPYLLFRRGFANYTATQEGLATYNQNMHLGPGDDRRYNAPRNVLGLSFSLKHSLAETRQYLEELGYHKEKAMSQALSFKRGLRDTSKSGGFTKSVSYLKGLRDIEKFVKDGGDLKRLYIGRIALEDLELIEQIPDVKGPLLLPKWLR